MGGTQAHSKSASDVHRLASWSFRRIKQFAGRPARYWPLPTAVAENMLGSTMECLMPAYDYELVVIGGGPAGEKGAAQAAYFGHKTIVIEAYRELGGACINWGTLASKTLRESALFLSGFRTRQLGEGLNVQFKADITLNSFMHRKNLVQRREQERAARNLASSWHNIACMTGVARIVDPNTVQVTSPDGSVKKVRGKIILVATGSTPARPKNVQFNDDNIFDATTVLEMKQLPKSIVVIGGGVIGSEYACLFN